MSIRTDVIKINCIRNTSWSVLINTSCVTSKHQSTITRFGDSWDKRYRHYTRPSGEGAYNLQSISATPKKVVWFTRLIHPLRHGISFLPSLSSFFFLCCFKKARKSRKKVSITLHLLFILLQPLVHMTQLVTC